MSRFQLGLTPMLLLLPLLAKADCPPPAFICELPNHYTLLHPDTSGGTPWMYAISESSGDIGGLVRDEHLAKDEILAHNLLGDGQVCLHSSVIGSCQPNHLPPEPIQVFCLASFGTHHCEVWPQGPGVSYTWTAGHGVTLDFPGTSTFPLQGLTCIGAPGGAWAHVQVTSPHGIGQGQYVSVNCGPSQIEY